MENKTEINWDLEREKGKVWDSCKKEAQEQISKKERSFIIAIWSAFFVNCLVKDGFIARNDFLETILKSALYSGLLVLPVLLLEMVAEEFLNDKTKMDKCFSFVFWILGMLFVAAWIYNTFYEM